MVIRDEFVDAAVQAVPIDSDCFLNNEAFDAIFERFAGHTPIIHGGSLRDVYNGRMPGDYDLIIDAPLELKEELSRPAEAAFSVGGFSHWSGHSKPGVLAYFAGGRVDYWGESPFWGDDDEDYGHIRRDKVVSRYFSQMGFEVKHRDIQFIKYSHFGADIIQVRMEEGYKCDVILNLSETSDVQKIAVAGEAAINSVAMGEDRQAYAHPNFLSDLQAQRYVARIKGDEAIMHAKNRWYQLKRRYPSLEFSTMS